MFKGSRESCGSHSRALRLLLLILLCATETIVALKCRSKEGLSDAELKRVARICMRKMGESAWPSDHGNEHGNDNDSGSFVPASSFGFSNNNNNGQTRAQQDGHGGYYNNYDDAAEHNHNHNYNYPTGNYERSDDIWRQRNRDRDRSQMNHTSRITKSPTNNERESHDRKQNGSGSAYSYGNNGHQQHGNGSACLAHCFFGQLHMLNNDDYPDRHKVSYVLSKDLRDRELRNFYGETIQQCFHYVESQRRQDKCHFSRELISCMSEYAQANCEDWQQYSVIFN